MDITPAALPDGGTAEQTIVEGTLGPAEVNPLQTDRSNKGMCMAGVLSTVQQMINVEWQSDCITDYELKWLTEAELQGKIARHPSGSALKEHQAVMYATSSEEEVSLNVSTPRASLNEPLHVPNNWKAPKKVLRIDLGCLEVTNFLLKVLGFWKAQELYICLHLGQASWYRKVPVGGERDYRLCWPKLEKEGIVFIDSLERSD